MNLSQRAAREAAYWMMRMQDGGLSPAARRRWRAWRAESEEHERAWRRAEQVTGTLDSVPSALAAPALRRAASRRNAVKTLALVLTGAPLGWAAWRAAPWDEWRADQCTAAGERRDITLPDGSSLTLNTDTALNVRFDAATRTVHLLRGEILVQTAPDPAGRSFIVRGPQGSMRALGTRFTVRLDEAHTRLAVLQGAVEVSPANASAYRLPAGSQTRFSTAGGAVEGLNEDAAAAWVDGVLYAERMPLGEFIAELARYRPGLLRCDPAAAHLRVSGAFQLRDTDGVLKALASSLPVRLQARTRYWITVAPA
ncbi:hypothetical protein ASD15_25625 [Massilia sp. Root351]|jgi:transmembrane sensor|uniref:FecR domain-containing protein n=1 Tax=Massilia sp. Root351 TaxID=1736522 RepID=UPI000709302B|nr:FecR domain-containing protein [Massilia sp. Root351]KQV90056.1 hypothetical protein ASD15_25625 [Massilia sp. Root351]